MSELQALLERVRAADEPDGDLNYLLEDTLFPGERQRRWGAFLKSAPSSMSANLGPADIDGYITPRAPYTSSIDAALALVERLLPGTDFFVEVEQVHGGFCQYVRLAAGGAIAPIREPTAGKLYPTWKQAKDCLPLAIVAAALSALIAQATESAA